MAEMQQQPVYTELACPEGYVRRESGIGQNNPSAGSVGASAILGGTDDGDTPRNISQRKIDQAR